MPNAPNSRKQPTIKICPKICFYAKFHSKNLFEINPTKTVKIPKKYRNSLNGHQTKLARMFPLTFQQGWCREKASAFAMAHSFTWNGARPETRVIDSA
jgi:hypothetical protein